MSGEEYAEALRAEAFGHMIMEGRKGQPKPPSGLAHAALLEAILDNYSYGGGGFCWVWERPQSNKPGDKT